MEGQSPLGGTQGPPWSGPDWAKLHPSVCEVTAPPAYFHVTAPAPSVVWQCPPHSSVPLSATACLFLHLQFNWLVWEAFSSPLGDVRSSLTLPSGASQGPGVFYRVSWLARYIRGLSTTLISPGKCISLSNLCRSCEGLPPAVTL